MKLLFYIFIFFSFNSFAQKESFPNSFVGKWQGNLEIMGVDTIIMNVKMSIDIQPTKNDSVFKWETTYFKSDSTKDIRPYELKVIDKLRGIYVLDEKNSILIDSYYRNNTLTSFFSVLETLLVFSYTLSDNKMIVDVFSAPSKPISTTGGELINEEEIPEVESFFISGRQRAILVRH